MKNNGRIKYSNEKGITLIALVVTIIVLLILAGITINLAFNSNGILNRASQAKEASRAGVIQDETAMWKINNQIINKTNKIGSVSLNNFTQELFDKDLITQDEKTKIEKDKTIIIGGIVIDFNESIISPGEEITIIENGKTVKLSKDNFGEYLGMKVLYKPRKKHTDYGTSEIYRLFYVDFDNKYGDGPGTIYLKADSDYVAGKYKTFQNVKGDQTGHKIADNSKSRMAKHNPMWAKSGDNTGTNKSCVSFMMDENEWTDWIDNSTSGISGKVNYVVGGPSLEMFVDSYNAMHGKGNTPGSGATKLCCKYDGAPGYKVGINNEDYSYYNGYETDSNTLKPDIKGRKMLNSGVGEYYWLASPSAWNIGGVMASYGNNNQVNCTLGAVAFCPLVSLQFDAKLMGLPD